MKENKYSWNETLKFSWGHIIAFTALIFLSYVMYMGCFYSNGGDFTKAAVKVAVIDLALLVTFLGAQIIKGSDHNFDRSIIVERILIVLCPIVFIWAMVPYNHFWNVFSEREEIKDIFNSSILNSQKIFDDYDQYSQNRLSNYENVLDTMLMKDSSMNESVKENYLTTLKLQLLSQNTENIKHHALAWIKDANQGATVWNAFLVGNIDQIISAIEAWNKTLVSYTTNVLSNEMKYGNEVVPYSGSSYQQSIKGLKALTNIYTQSHGLNFNTIWTGIILFLMLLFPYILQSRNVKTTGLYSLLPKKITSKDKGRNIQYHPDTRREDDSETTFKPHVSRNSQNDDIYGGTF